MATEQVVMTVDVAVLRQTYGQGLQVLLIQRAKDPYREMWAFPGGKLDTQDMSLEDAARREAFEETGVLLDTLQQVGTYGNAGRDPRGRYVSVLYVASVHPRSAFTPYAGSDASHVDWFPLFPAPGVLLAFDHATMLADVMAHLQEVM